MRQPRPSSSEPKQQRPRRPLSPERIARAALKLIDRRGLEAFSMHKLSASLGCETMSLYHHLKNRGEVLDAVAGLLMAEIHAPDEGTWQDRLRGFAHSYRAIALAHPRAFALLATRPVNRPEGFAMLESASSTLRSAGFEPERAARFVLLVGCWCNGALLAEIAGTDARPDPTPPTAPQQADLAQRYPNLVEMAPHLSLCNFAPAFDFGLEALIRLVSASAATPSASFVVNEDEPSLAP
ncbi:MAG TPA: TetR/AcrR family transcriptional regulator C-terminal domain-containing protein [Polyangiaceae bacterium]|nr:TetR/AcrR family transcriptional regulator C-terminal domain-containing protein [Polyangiaceae bacterium]